MKLANHQKKNKQQDNEGLSQGIKNTAGAAFHTIHSALETTENAAMNAVDATTNAINNLTDEEDNSRRNQEKK
jgi:hypothetical protein